MKRLRKPTLETALEIRYRHCCMLLLMCQYSYYGLAISLLSDAEYDRFNDRLIRFEQENPGMRHQKSPTESIGSDLESSYPPGLVAYVNEQNDKGDLRVEADKWEDVFRELPVKDPKQGLRL